MHNINPIGIIHSPHQSIEDMPIQPKGASEFAVQDSVSGWLEASDEEIRKKRSDERFR